MKLRYPTTLLACALLGALGCGEAPASTPELGGATEERSPLNCSEGWDPIWSQGPGANSWWVEYVIEGDGVSSAQLEVIGLGVVDLSFEWGKWTGSPSFAIGSGASAILHATNGLGQSAQTRVFSYLVDTLPVTDCIGDGECVPSCGDRECGGDGCGGSCGSCGGGEQCQAGYCEAFPDEGGTFQESVWVSGLTSPTTAAFTSDGRMLVAERFGRLRVVKNGALLSTPFLTVPVTTQGERGLIGVAVDPDFESNGHVYVYYSYSGGDDRGFSRISRFTASASNPDVAAAGSERILINDIPNYIWHNAGALHFGADGMLYFAVGDNNNRPSAQSLGAITGKIGRIDPSSYPNIIPPDNPFVGVPGAREEIWALGFRNPFTFAVDPGSDRIYVNDVGDADWEEVNALQKGANYGWARCEGEYLLTSNQRCNDAALTNPLFAYPHDDNGGLFGCSVIGGAFYRGSQFPAQYQGDYFFVDYCERWIARITPDGQVLPFFEPSWSLITTLLQGPDGALYYVNNGTGVIWKLEYVGGNGNRSPVARASASTTSGSAPLTVGFDGRGSSDPDGDALSYTWRFGDGTSASGATTSHTYTSGGRYQATLTVSDGNGGVDSATVTVDVTGGGGGGGVAITAPAADDTYDAGEIYAFRGTAVNGAGQPLPASAYSWVIWFHHDEHRHPFLGPIDGVTSGTFTIPTVGEISANVWYRIHLYVTDGGTTHEVVRDLYPNKAFVTLRTDPPGLTLLLDEGTIDGTQSIESVTGVLRQLEAPSPQQSGGRWYEFASWSDGGARSHTIATPSSDTTYTARFVEVGQPDEDADAILYDEALHWADWSWGTSLNPSATSPAQGSRSLAVTYTSGWAALSLQRDAFDTGPYEALRFALHPGGRPLPAAVAWFHRQGGASTSEVDIRDYASAIGGGWYRIEIPLSALGATDTTVTRLNLQDLSGASQATFHVDDIRLTAGASNPPPPPPPPPPPGPALSLYDDALAWDDWSWGVTLADVTTPVYGGTRSLALTYTAAWGGLSLHHDGFDTSPYTHLVMALRPTGGTLPRLTASLYDPAEDILAEVEVRPWSTALEGGWFLVEIPLAELGAGNATVTRVQLQDGTGGPLPTLHVDDLGFASR